MKNIDYNNLLMYVSLVLAVAILLSILFGCTYRKRNGYREYFTATTVTEPQATAGTPATPNETSKPSEPNNKKVADANAELNPTELQLKEKLIGGKLNENDLQQMVDNKEVSTENLQKIIQSFQNDLKLQ